MPYFYVSTSTNDVNCLSRKYILPPASSDPNYGNILWFIKTISFVAPSDLINVGILMHAPSDGDSFNLHSLEISQSLPKKVIYNNGTNIFLSSEDSGSNLMGVDGSCSVSNAFILPLNAPLGTTFTGILYSSSAQVDVYSFDYITYPPVDGSIYDAYNDGHGLIGISTIIQ